MPHQAKGLRWTSAVVGVITCQYLRQVNQNARFGVVGVIGRIDGKDAPANGRAGDNNQRQYMTGRGEGVKNNVATSEDLVAGVTGDAEGVGRGNGQGGVKGEALS